MLGPFLKTFSTLFQEEKFLTKKHVLLGTGLHSLRGQKIPINVLCRFGHCCNYDKVRLIETAQAEVVQKLRSLEFPLPLLPSNAEDKVLTFFWWDNFDVQKENHLGSLHTTHGIAYQVKSKECIATQTYIEVPKSKRKSITCTPLDLPRRKIVPHKEPPKFKEQQSLEFDAQYADKLVFLWKLMRRVFSESPQCISRFVGWVTLAFGQPNSTGTTLTFLPPIANPITDYSTVAECIKQSQDLAKASNMQYAHHSGCWCSNEILPRGMEQPC